MVDAVKIAVILEAPPAEHGRVRLKSAALQRRRIFLGRGGLARDSPGLALSLGTKLVALRAQRGVALRDVAPIPLERASKRHVGRLRHAVLVAAEQDELITDRIVFFLHRCVLLIQRQIDAFTVVVTKVRDH